MVNTRDHKLFHRVDTKANSNHMVLLKVTIIIQLLDTVEAEKQDAQINL